MRHMGKPRQNGISQSPAHSSHNSRISTSSLPQLHSDCHGKAGWNSSEITAIFFQTADSMPTQCSSSTVSNQLHHSNLKMDTYPRQKSRKGKQMRTHPIKPLYLIRIPTKILVKFNKISGGRQINNQLKCWNYLTHPGYFPLNPWFQMRELASNDTVIANINIWLGTNRHFHRLPTKTWPTTLSSTTSVFKVWVAPDRNIGYKSADELHPVTTHW